MAAVVPNFLTIICIAFPWNYRLIHSENTNFPCQLVAHTRFTVCSGRRRRPSLCLIDSLLRSVLPGSCTTKVFSIREILPITQADVKSLDQIGPRMFVTSNASGSCRGHNWGGVCHQTRDTFGAILSNALVNRNVELF